MFAKFFKKEQKNSINKEILNNTSFYKNLEFRRINVDGLIEYEVTLTDTTTAGNPFSIKKYLIKITHDISFSIKRFNLNNELTFNHFEVIPCAGIEKVTSEFKCDLNYGYEYNFHFKFWHKTIEASSCSDKPYIYWGPGEYIRNPEYPEGMEELIYQIQRDMQEAIENGKS
ncbi:TPA: hypothetical protein ACOQ31_005028 [Bacillus cereus]|uniref:hypothetical protein n=1 Tax=Bacillus cereus TaxID=1396 RepID=UPI0019286C5B|nr:hypothetical protein [Bacillus cereus]MBL3768520.1 hypothetical protein [Bacillus cereus]HDR8205116.1 hypothetical protein [Bacillus cereus]HDR8211037.1 hypothetical protein [Bacillus cereus]HDR8225184.1 hypothetical protein [Bacillus cereus]HDR8237674.1 hypothetical protein [Bacillus cereus]